MFQHWLLFAGLLAGKAGIVLPASPEAGMRESDPAAAAFAVFSEAVGTVSDRGPCCLGFDCSVRSVSQCVSLAGTFAGFGAECEAMTCAMVGCQSATLIPTTPYSQVFDNSSAPASAPPGTCNGSDAGGQMRNAQWFRWTAPVSATAILTVTPDGEFGYDAIVAVYSGTCDNLVEVACGDEPQPIRVSFCARENVTYYFECGSYGAISGGGPTEIALVTLAPKGACCLQTGGCIVETQQECGAGNGMYAGDCTTCAAASCAPGGACCIIGNCVQRTVAACAAQGGAHAGVGTFCYAASGEPALTFTATPNLAIPDNDPAGVTSTLSIAQGTFAVDVNVFVNVPNHAFISDLTIKLTHNGETRVLWDRACSNEHGLLVTFDDEGSNDNCEEPTVGPLKPSLFGDGLLELFEQKSIAGSWLLNVSDNAPPDTATLTSWGLIVTPGTSVCSRVCNHGDSNCSGSVNNFDIDPFVQSLVNGDSQAAPPGYLMAGGTQSCWALRSCWGDINRDQLLNNFDIDPFVICILNLPPPGTECP